MKFGQVVDKNSTKRMLHSLFCFFFYFLAKLWDIRPKKWKNSNFFDKNPKIWPKNEKIKKVNATFFLGCIGISLILVGADEL